MLLPSLSTLSTVLLAVGLTSVSAIPAAPRSAEPMFKQTSRRDVIARQVRRSLGIRAAPSPQVAPTSVTSDGVVYNRFYQGSGSIETDNNPANSSPQAHAPSQTTFASTVLQNTAIQQCADYAISVQKGYFSFELYFANQDDIWVCRAYWGSGSDSTYFNVADADATNVFGFQSELPS